MCFYLCIMNSILEIFTSFYLTLIITIMFGKGFIRLYLLRLCTNGLNKRYLKLSATCSIDRKVPLEVNNRPCELKSYPDQLTDQYAFVPISSIKQKLLQRDKVFLDGHTCISMTCPSCKSPALSLYINKITGSFVCISCKKSGSWDLLETYFNSKRPMDLPQDESMNYGKNAWAELSSQLTELDDNFISSSFLSDLKVPLHLYDEVEAKLDPSTNEICFPLMSDKDSVGYKILKSDFSEETFPYKGAKGIVVCKREKKTAVIVAKMLDFLSLLHLPLDHDIICLPHGQESLPQEVLPLFEQYSELVLWFDNDNVSWGNAKMFAKKLSESRCSLVRPLENQPAPYDCLQSGYDILNVIENAQPVSHSSIVTFANLREDVLTELYNADKVSGVKWERFPTLNTILKGHRRGELTILTGPTGSGKTTFMSEYSLDLACNKVTTLWGSFEIRNQRLAKTMMTQMFSAPLEKNLDKFNEWADKFERLPIYFMTFHGQQPLNIVMEAVEHATYVHDVAHVIIDNVQFMLGLSSNESGFMDRFYRQDALIASFRNFATTFNCHVTLVIHPRKERDAEQLSALSIFGGAKAAQEADNILIIQHRTSHTSLRIKKFLQVAKNRFSGDLGIMPLEFDKESLSFRTRQK